MTNCWHAQTKESPIPIQKGFADFQLYFFSVAFKNGYGDRENLARPRNQSDCIIRRTPLASNYHEFKI